jgi:hypothetical protein
MGNLCGFDYIRHDRLDTSTSPIFGKENYLSKCSEQIADYDLRLKLKESGHTCVSILESYPPTTVWCHQKVCINK